jgi:hypothetical protein
MQIAAGRDRVDAHPTPVMITLALGFVAAGIVVLSLESVWVALVLFGIAGWLVHIA